jgi:hypothetical protein
MTIPVGGVDCTVNVQVFTVYCATAVVGEVAVGVISFSPAGCGVPFRVQQEKVYPVGSVAGATRSTLVPYATLGTV